MSLWLLSFTTTTTTTASSSLSCGANGLFSNTTCKRPTYISCKQPPPPETNNVIDRRNVLLGLSGVYGATATLGSTAFGNPIQPPDLGNCHLATDAQMPEGQDNKFECCPPKYKNTTLQDFQLPKFTHLRTRRPAHKYDSADVAKYEEAIRRMKALPEDDPWNFYQQAQVHCAFCNNAYDQYGHEGVPLQVHYSFLFGPWHRYYLYFWEKILGKLMDDPTFAIPYWSWDTPPGMYMPPMYYKDINSSLYNDSRNKDHYTALLDFKYKHGDANPTPEQKDGVILGNLLRMESIFTEAKRKSSLFMGGPVEAGDVPYQDVGALETIHTLLHQWVGPPAKPNWDMGNFHTAAKDTLFWGHHANCDRLWYLFTSFRGNKPEFKDENWLNASFVFYDENRQLVRCETRDCLDVTKLGYTYEAVELPWLNVRRSYIKQQRAREKMGRKKENLIEVGEFGSAPQLLRHPIRVLVPRPKTALSKDDKEQVLEVLTIDDIVMTDPDQHQRFDVYVSKPINGKASSDLGEFAGAFTYIPVSHKSDKGKTVVNIGITSLVENIEADASENLVVSLIPGIGEVTIGGVKISLSDIDD